MRKSALPRFGNFDLLCFIIILTIVVASCSRSERYVQADVLKLRSEPSEGAHEVGRLRINTEIRVLEKRKDWVKILANGLEGWTPCSLLGDKPLTSAYALEQAKFAMGADRVQWLERAVALDSTNSGVWKSLADAYSALGNKERSEYARQVVSGGQPIFVAACSSEIVKLYSVYEPPSGFRKLTGEFISQQYVDEDGIMDSSPQQKPILSEEGIVMKRDLARLVEKLPDLNWSRLSNVQVSDIWFPPDENL